MKRLAIALVCTAGAFAAQANTFFDTARVRSAEPQYESVNVPRQECRTEWVSETRSVSSGRTNYNGAVLGALAGGVLGNQVGGGSGRDAATVLGAVVGAFAGDHMAGNNRQEQVQLAPRQVQRCHTVTEVQSRITGYRVAYDYRGQTYTTVMRDNPGAHLQVRVSVDPVVHH